MQNERHNTDAAMAARFLKDFRPKGGAMNLVAICPKGVNIDGITRPINHPNILAFIERYNGRHNLYFMPNEPGPDAPDKKLSKTHIRKIHAIYLDADPDRRKPFEAERERLPSRALEHLRWALGCSVCVDRVYGVHINRGGVRPYIYPRARSFSKLSSVSLSIVRPARSEVLVVASSAMISSMLAAGLSTGKVMFFSPRER